MRTVHSQLHVGANPLIGFANATQVAQEALATGQSVVLAKGLLSKAMLKEVLRPEALTRPRLIDAKRE